MHLTVLGMSYNLSQPPTKSLFIHNPRFTGSINITHQNVPWVGGEENDVPMTELKLTMPNVLHARINVRTKLRIDTLRTNVRISRAVYRLHDIQLVIDSNHLTQF